MCEEEEEKEEATASDPYPHSCRDHNVLSVAKCFARLLGIWQSRDPTGDFLGSFSPLA